MFHAGQKTVRKLDRGKLLLHVSQWCLMQVCLKKAGQRSQGHNKTFQYSFTLHKSKISVVMNLPGEDLLTHPSHIFIWYRIWVQVAVLFSVYHGNRHPNSHHQCPPLSHNPVVFRTCLSGFCLHMFQEAGWALIFLSCLWGVKWDAEMSLKYQGITNNLILTTTLTLKFSYQAHNTG